MIGGVGFAGPDELNRAVRALQHALKTGGIARDKFGTFIGGETASPDDGEAVRIEDTTSLFANDAEEVFFQSAFTAPEGFLVP